MNLQQNDLLQQQILIFLIIFLTFKDQQKLLGNLQMNDNRITGLTNPPNADDEATNKK